MIPLVVRHNITTNQRNLQQAFAFDVICFVIKRVNILSKYYLVILHSITLNQYFQAISVPEARLKHDSHFVCATIGYP